MRETETAEIAGLRAVFAAAPPDLVAAHGIGVLDLGDGTAVRVRTLPGVPEVNHAVGVADAEALDEVDVFFGDTAHAVSPDPDVDLDTALAARGYRPGYGWMKFERGIEPSPRGETDLRVIEVGADGGIDFGRTLCAGYGMPEFMIPWLSRLPDQGGLHCFVAYDGTEPVAAGALHIHEPLGWLGLAATLPSHRGRGAQNEILARRIARAVECGCTLIVTETGERLPDRPSSSYRNILRQGFREAYVRPNWVIGSDPSR